MPNDITPTTVLAFLKEHTRPARYRREARADVAEVFLHWAGQPDTAATRTTFAAALTGAGIELVRTKRGIALDGVKLNDLLPLYPPNAPDVGPFLPACLQQTDKDHAITRDHAWRLYCEWAGDIEHDNEHARRRFFAAMRRRVTEVRRSEGWYYRGVCAKGKTGIRISGSDET